MFVPAMHPRPPAHGVPPVQHGMPDPPHELELHMPRLQVSPVWQVLPEQQRSLGPPQG
jgi:hypothetical protein